MRKQGQFWIFRLWKLRKSGDLKFISKSLEIYFKFGKRIIPMESQKSLIQHAKKISKKRKIAKVTEKAAIPRLIFYKHRIWHAYCFINGHGY